MLSITQEQEQLIELVCADPDFAKPKRSPDLLRALFRNPDSKEERIKAVDAILKSAPEIRKGVGRATEISRLQDRLDVYFKTQGKHQRWRIHIRRATDADSKGARPLDIYRLTFPPNVATDTALRSFWRSYFDGRPTVIAYGEPVFATDEQHTVFIQDTNFNVTEDFHNPRLLRKSFIGKLPKKDQSPIYTFVTLGEMLCMVQLTRWLAPNGVDVSEEGYNREDTLDAFLGHKASPSGANAVLLGAARVNGVLDSYQNHYIKKSPAPFMLDADGIRDRIHHQQRPWKDKTRDSVTYTHALVTRMPGVESGVVTLLASNYGRAIQGLGKVLTSETEMDRHVEHVFDDWRQSNERQSNERQSTVQMPPPWFQLVFRFEISDHGRVITDTELIDWWPRGTKRQL